MAEKSSLLFVAVDMEGDDTKEVRERGRQRLKWLAAILMVLAVVGCGVGFGVGGQGTRAKAKLHSNIDQTPGNETMQASPLNASNITAGQLKFLPESQPEVKLMLQDVNTDEAKAALQQLADVEEITPEVVKNFLDFFDKKANLTKRGVDVTYLKAQAYNVVRWLKARPELRAVLDLLRKYAKDPNFTAAELAEAIDQVEGLNVKDFQQFISRKPDRSDKLDDSALHKMVEVTAEDESGDSDDSPPATTTTVDKGKRSLLAGDQYNHDAIGNQATLKATPGYYLID